MSRRQASLILLLSLTGGAAFLPIRAKADAALYIFHGLSSEGMPANGMELVCLGPAPKVRSCRAARTTDGVEIKSVKVDAAKGQGLLKKYALALKPYARAKAPSCRASLSFSSEWNEKKIKRSLCAEDKRDRAATHVLLKAEHAITSLLER